MRQNQMKELFGMQQQIIREQRIMIEGLLNRVLGSAKEVKLVEPIEDDEEQPYGMPKSVESFDYTGSIVNHPIP